MAAEMCGMTPMPQSKNLDETIALCTKVLGFSVNNRMEGWCHLTWGKADVMF